ncbi:MAG: hypothetical protein ACRYGG_17020, partial [Janthinobacterium lividum]
RDADDLTQGLVTGVELARRNGFLSSLSIVRIRIVGVGRQEIDVPRPDRDGDNPQEAESGPRRPGP